VETFLQKYLLENIPDCTKNKSFALYIHQCGITIFPIGEISPNMVALTPKKSKLYWRVVQYKTITYSLIQNKTYINSNLNFSINQSTKHQKQEVFK
jgi:hypothetical protein